MVIRTDIFSEGCIYINNVYMYICQHRTSFPKEQSAKAQVEEVFHIDLCDKINQLSSGELYYFFFFY